jgi:hypothetical protein
MAGMKNPKVKFCNCNKNKQQNRRLQASKQAVA